MPVSDFAIPKKLVAVGDGACGKTALLTVFAASQSSSASPSPRAFPSSYDPTPSEKHVADTILAVDGTRVEFALWDTGGSNRGDHDMFRPLAYPNADLFLLCFALDSAASLESVSTQWVPEVRRYSAAPLILVGCKLDLWSPPGGQQNGDVDAVVRRRGGAAMRRKYKATVYLECSAKTGEGVNEVFQAAARAALRVTMRRGCGGCIVV